MRKLNIVLSIVAFITMLVSCRELPQPSKEIPVTGIILSQGGVQLLLGEEKTISAVVQPADATDKNVRWSSSDDKIVSVKDGKIKGLAVGEATITARAGDKSSLCSVLVREPNLVETGDVVGHPYKTSDLNIKLFFEYAEQGAAFEDAGVVFGVNRIIDFDKDRHQGVLERNADGRPEKRDSYIVRVQGLEEETTYYYKAYAVFGGKFYFGEMKSFTTLKSGVSTEKLLDLGLSVKWAGWNVGASKPEDLGDYFPWGVTSAEENASYKWAGEGGKLLKYNTRPELGAVDGKSVLELIDDAAAYNWEEKWRMPTENEKRELLTNTVQSKYTYKGVPGYIFTSKKNGVSIFFPASGYSKYAVVNGKGSITAFWTSTLFNSDDRAASLACSHVIENGNFLPEASMISDLGFYWETVTTQRQNFYRFYGLPVRPVWDEHREKLVIPFSICLGSTSDITSSSAKLSGKIKDFFRDGRTLSDLPEFGFCLRKGLDASPTVNDIKVICKASDGVQEGKDFVYSKKVEGLEGDTDYKIAAYIISNGAPTYQSGYKFRTWFGSLNPELKEVDLGLPSGLKWAGWNLGATKITELGTEYRWGDTRVNVSDYKWWDRDKKFTKYVLAGEEKYGSPVDNLSVLEASDDAAVELWGDNWRTPTMGEIKELKENCTVKDLFYEGFRGLLLTGPNGKSLFFLVDYNSQKAKYWSVNRRTGDSDPYVNISFAHIMEMQYETSAEKRFQIDQFARRYQKSYIRPVKSK